MCLLLRKWCHVISITRRCVLVSNTKLLNGRYEIWFYAFWHWTLAAEALGLPCISPYLKSIGPDYKHGANYARLASTVLLPNASLFVTGIQVEEFHHSSDQQGEHIHMNTMSSPNCLNLRSYAGFCWFWLLRLLLLRTDKTSFRGCYWEITLHPYTSAKTISPPIWEPLVWLDKWSYKLLVPSRWASTWFYTLCWANELWAWSSMGEKLSFTGCIKRVSHIHGHVLLACYKKVMHVVSCNGCIVFSP